MVFASTASSSFQVPPDSTRRGKRSDPVWLRHISPSFASTARRSPSETSLSSGTQDTVTRQAAEVHETFPERSLVNLCRWPTSSCGAGGLASGQGFGSHPIAVGRDRLLLADMRLLFRQPGGRRQPRSAAQLLKFTPGLLPFAPSTGAKPTVLS